MSLTVTVTDRYSIRREDTGGWTVVETGTDDPPVTGIVHPWYSGAVAEVWGLS